MKIDATKILILAALGFGAYYLTMRKTATVGAAVRPGVMPQYSATPNAYSPVGPQQQNALGWGQALGAITGLFTGPTQPNYTSQLPGDMGSSEGWTRYSDGTAISPLGDYYVNGVKTWSPYGSDNAAVNLANQYEVGAYIPLPE